MSLQSASCTLVFFASLWCGTLAYSSAPALSREHARFGATTVLRAGLQRHGPRLRIVMDPTRDPAVTVWNGSHRIWQGIPRRWKPWKLLVGDVDGDGRREILVGITKGTRFWRAPHHCLFLYEWNGGTLKPKWRGSRLSQPFTDFAVGPLDGDGRDELVSIETRADGRQCVVAYGWNGFGFTGEWVRGSWRHARLLGVGYHRVALFADGKRLILRA